MEIVGTHRSLKSWHHSYWFAHIFEHPTEYDGINYTPRNVGSYPKDIDPDLLSRLQDFYRPHNQKLEEFLGRKFNWD